jgi:hypothetical protein
MKRAILAFIAGAIAWAVVAQLFDWGLRLGIGGYHAAERALIAAHLMTFTLPMMIGRLTLAVVADLAAGIVVGRIATAARLPLAGLLGAVILVLFLPSHIQLFRLFPLWYHLAFLVPLIPLVVLGATLARGGEGTQAAARAA